jgi:hypothetical protein
MRTIRISRAASTYSDHSNMDPTFLGLLLSTRTWRATIVYSDHSNGSNFSLPFAINEDSISDKRSNQSFSFADKKESKRHASRLHNFMYPENVLLRQSLGASMRVVSPSRPMTRGKGYLFLQVYYSIWNCRECRKGIIISRSVKFDLDSA